MHYCQTKKFLGRGHRPLPIPLPHWGAGYTLPRTPLGAFGASILALKAFPFLFIYDSNTDFNRTYFA